MPHYLSLPLLITCITYCTEYLGMCSTKCHNSILDVLFIETGPNLVFFF